MEGKGAQLEKKKQSLVQSKSLSRNMENMGRQLQDDLKDDLQRGGDIPVGTTTEQC